MDADRFLRGLLHECAASMPDLVLSEAVRRAFLETPRHRFVRRYRRQDDREWHTVTADDLAEHLGAIYQNRILILVGDDPDVRVTISTPSFVLRTLELLRLEPGQRVLEVGAGSGWHAALMGRLVAPGGRVTSLEIREELVAPARETLSSLGIENVDIVAGDGAEGNAGAGPFDRAIFTAGAQDLPGVLHEQMRPGGRILFALKVPGTWDRLLFLRKEPDHFACERFEIIGIVPMHGRLATREPILRALVHLPGWAEMQDRIVARRPFFWGGLGRQGFDGRTGVARDFVARTVPGFEAFRRGPADRWWGDDVTFGVWGPDGSLALVEDDVLVSYGSREAESLLLAALHEWVECGLPGPSCYDVRIYPAAASVPGCPHRWIQRGPDSQIVWDLAAP